MILMSLLFRHTQTLSLLFFPFSSLIELHKFARKHETYKFYIYILIMNKHWKKKYQAIEKGIRESKL